MCKDPDLQLVCKNPDLQLEENTAYVAEGAAKEDDGEGVYEAYSL